MYCVLKRTDCHWNTIAAASAMRMRELTLNLHTNASSYTVISFSFTHCIHIPTAKEENTLKS